MKWREVKRTRIRNGVKFKTRGNTLFLCSKKVKDQNLSFSLSLSPSQLGRHSVATQWARSRLSTASSPEAQWFWPSTPSSPVISRRLLLSVSRSFLPPATASSLTTAITIPSISSSKMATVWFPLSLSLFSCFLFQFSRGNERTVSRKGAVLVWSRILGIDGSSSWLALADVHHLNS